MFSSIRISSCNFYYFSKHIRIYFLYGHWVSWISCYMTRCILLIGSFRIEWDNRCRNPPRPCASRRVEGVLIYQTLQSSHPPILQSSNLPNPFLFFFPSSFRYCIPPFLFLLIVMDLQASNPRSLRVPRRDSRSDNNCLLSY